MTSPAVAQTAAPAPIPTDAEIRHMLVTRVETQRQATGIVVGIVDSTGRRIIAYGTMGLDDKRPMGGDTVFDVGSITKVFTALLLSDMVQRGEVALDDPVTKLLAAKDLPFLGRGDREVTLLDLATHTSGLPLRPGNLVSEDPGNKYAGYTSEMLHEFLASFEFDRSPGSEHQYSNVGYGLLGEALSRRSGASSRDLL
jgi:CubicO group peptidase (beta-lactamase class C family)